MRSRQKGIALISILLVFVFAVIMVTAMLKQQRLGFARTSFLIEYQRAKQYALGGEQIARALLNSDVQEDTKKGVIADSRNEGWAYQIEKPFDDAQEPASTSYIVSDLQGCFNLNNLVLGSGAVAADYRQTYQALLGVLGAPLELADETIDWIDSNQNTLAQGAEEGTYLSEDPPYRNGDTNMVDISELRLLKSMTSEGYQLLRPHVCTLDYVTALNVNTITVELLQAVVPGLDAVSAEGHYETLGNSPVDTIADFTDLVRPSSPGYATTVLAVRSNFFQVRSKGQYNDTEADLVSTVFRDANDGTIWVLERNWGQSLPRLTSQ